MYFIQLLLFWSFVLKMDSTFLRNANTRYQTARGHIPEYRDIGAKRNENPSVMSRYCELIWAQGWNQRCETLMSMSRGKVPVQIQCHAVGTVNVHLLGDHISGRKLFKCLS
jgi:hypothetical protein